MVIVLVTFPAPDSPIENPRALLEATAPPYREVAGLCRKYFIGNADLAGGVYHWADRSSAERFYDDAWHARIRDRYGVEPALQFFDAPCLVDNVAGEIVYDV